MRLKDIIKDIKILSIKTFVNIHKFLFPRTDIANTAPKRFLIISTTGIGDTLWGTAAIRSLKETYPESYIAVLANPTGMELLHGNPYIDEIFTFSRGIKGFLSLPSLLKILKNERFETVFIFHASDRIVWLIGFLTSAPQIIGIDGQNKGLDFILTHRINQQNNIHGIEARFNLIKEAEVENFYRDISIYLTERDRESAQEFLDGCGINKDTIVIGLHPGAQKPFKCWHKNNFIKTGNILAKRFRCRIIITGNSYEKTLSDEIASSIKGAVPCAGTLPLRTTAAVIERMNLFITNDTGPMHIAFALKTPTIALFSPTDPSLCGPYHIQNAIVIKKPMTCDHCTGKECLNPICMEKITVDEVIKAAESLLNKAYE